LKVTFAALNFSTNLSLCVIFSDSESLRGVALSENTSAKHYLHGTLNTNNDQCVC